jgi:putative ABC transport system permease protein
VLGSEIAEDLFPQGIDPVGKDLKIGNIKFTIIGITKSKGSNSFENPDTYVNVPYETFNQYLVNRDTLTTLAIQASDQRLTEIAKGEAIEIMRKVRDVGLNEDDDFTVRDAGEILDTIRQFTGTLTAFLSLVAAISLLVGGIGVMNIMFVSITERTKEIGLRKSIGAKNSDILIQFLTESIVVTLLGGIMGIIVGVLLSLLVSSLVNLDYRLELDPILLGVGFSIVIGLVFGIYPARKASKLSPIDALRYE